MVTINDVAKYAGVSNATASRALRKIGSIRPSTILKVEKAAEELGFIINTTAQSLKTSTRNRVGLIVADVNNDYYHTFEASIQDALKSMNYQLTITFSSENPVDEKKSFQTLIGLGAAFIFFTPTCCTNEEIIDIARKNGIEVIQLFRKIYPNLPSIINDDEGGAYLAAQHLLSEGCHKLLLLDVDYAYLDHDIVTPNRSLGFRKALENADETVLSKILRLKIGHYDEEAIYAALADFQPDAILAASNDFGYSVLRYLKKHRLPTKLIVYDDNRWWEALEVSAVHQDFETLGEAVSSFIKKKERGSESIVIKEKLSLR